MSRLPNRIRQRGVSPRLPFVRLLRSWRHLKKGSEIQPPGALRQVLMSQGIVEEIQEEIKEDPKPVRRRKVKEDNAA